jgi:hypothetical protein
MSIPLKAGAVTVAHANSDKDNQIFMAAEAIWGIKSHKLPLAKFYELKTVLVGHLTRQYGPYKVEGKPLGSGNVFMIYIDPEVLETSYQKSPCSLDTCMVTNAAFKCARCQEAMYCSKEHQGQDWPRHKVECISKK